MNLWPRGSFRLYDFTLRYINNVWVLEIAEDYCHMVKLFSAKPTKKQIRVFKNVWYRSFVNERN